MNRKLIGVTGLLLSIPFHAHADAVSQLEAEYQAQGGTNLSAAAAEALWNNEFTDTKKGDKRSCATCHTADLKKPGKHARTGKTIEPMAPTADPKYLTKFKQINKWFVRNCRRTLGRECATQEKGNYLAYYKNL